MQNGYPHNTVWRILYQENREKADDKEKINLDYSFYVPFHPREKRFIKILKEQFGISTFFKKTQTLGVYYSRKEDK